MLHQARVVCSVLGIRSVGETTVTDAERDKLQQDTNLILKLRAALLHVGYPAEDVPLVQLVLESQEAVDREFDGS